MCGHEINRAIKSLQRRFRNIHLLISPIITAVDSLQKIVGDVNLKKLTTSENGSWQFSVCVNATTALCHTERDCTYTVITVPNQHAEKRIKSKNIPNFCFKLNEKQNVTLCYDYNLSFVFSGYYITHNQNPLENYFIKSFRSSICHHMEIKSCSLICVRRF